MSRLLILILLSTCGVSVVAQYTSQTYPDPRLDPLTCRSAFPSPVCDPSAVISDEERAHLVQRVNQLTAVTSGIRNTSPSCATTPDKNLEILIAIIDKIGILPNSAADIEKFANNLKRRYQHFQDVSACDTTVLIVNSRQDRQVFTVAGRDARISKETLKSAFERNIGYFKASRYALGLERMIEIIVAAYSNSHIVQVPGPEANFAQTQPQEELGSTEQSSLFRAAGLPTSSQPEVGQLNVLATQVDEDDKIWVRIMQEAVARCGQDEAQLAQHIRAVVENAMQLSLKLISDARYDSIEQEVERNKGTDGVREQAWQRAATEFVTPLFRKYRSLVLSSTSSVGVCPAVNRALW